MAETARSTRVEALVGRVPTAERRERRPVTTLSGRVGSLPHVGAAVTSQSPSRRLVIRQPRAQRGGRRFEPGPETRLEAAARLAIKALPGAERGVLAVREVPGPFGVPDFVALVGARGRLELRASLGVESIRNEVDARLVAAAPTRPSGIKVEALADSAQLPLPLVSRRLSQLVAAGALVLTSTGRLRRPVGLAPLGSIFAVEMKLTDWRRAVAQCRRYHVWADSYVLVTGELSASQIVRASTSVATDGGGLVVDGHVVTRPRVERARPSWRRLLAAEHFFAATSYGVQPSA